MLIINVDGSIDKAIKELKRKVYQTKQTLELRKRKEYQKPSRKRNAQLKKAKYNQKKSKN